MDVPFLDVRSQNKFLKKQSLAAVKRILETGDFILGKDVRLFEQEFAAYCGTRFAVGVNSGTDALFLSLLSLGIGPGDEVLCPVYTYIATALTISYAGATPVFVDIDPRTFTIDPADLERKITRKTKAIIPVHLYGYPADMPAIMRIARRHNLKVIEDAAQAQGARIIRCGGDSRKVGSWGDIGCFSFYPTKNLSGCGDGGMVTTDSKRVYETLLMWRDQGRRGKNRYVHFVRGYNSRLDTIQAALLREKLKHLDAWNEVRRSRAHLYSQLLSGMEGVVVPGEPDTVGHVFHLYAILLANRDDVHKKLFERGIHTGIVYHLPLHLQPAYKELNHRRGDFPAAEKTAKTVLCLPMHSHLTEQAVRYVAVNVKALAAKKR